MKRLVWLAMGAAMTMTASAVAAADKKAEEKEDDSIRAFNAAVLTAYTNGFGQVTNMTLPGSWGALNIITNGVPANTVREWGKLHDRAVETKGKFWFDKTNAMWFVKILSPIKDVTPSLKGGILQVTLTEDNKFSFMLYRTLDNRYSYDVQTNGMNGATLKGYYAYSEKAVEIDGKISQSNMKIYDVRSIRLARTASGKAPSSGTRKKGK